MTKFNDNDFNLIIKMLSNIGVKNNDIYSNKEGGFIIVDTRLPPFFDVPASGLSVIATKTANQELLTEEVKKHITDVSLKGINEQMKNSRNSSLEDSYVFFKISDPPYNM